MRNETQRSRARALGMVLASVLALACEGGGPTAPGEIPLLCPGCDPNAGGETTDFGMSFTECGALSAPVAVSEAEAVELGFDVASLQARMERPIDAELSWEADPYPSLSTGGKPASGYEDPTQVQAQVQVTRLAYHRPDPAHCVDGQCTLPDGDGTLIEQASCATFLMLHYDMQLSTLDGAVEASGEGEAAQWSEGFEDMVGNAAGELHGHAYIDLSDARGTLELDPDTDATYTGTLTVQLDFEDDMTHGYVTPTIRYTVIDENGDEEGKSYMPVQGTF